MKISVILPTIRPSGIEIALIGLSKQTMPQDDFELIIVDDYPGHEKEDAIRTMQGHGIKNAKWMRSKPSHWRTNAPIACARNTGLIHAEGELCVFIDDFTWVRPRFLEGHWRTFEQDRCPIGAVTSVEYSENPPADLSTLPVRYGDRRWQGAMQREEMKDAHPGWFFTSNASAPLDKIIEVNGFWEIMDLTREEDVVMGLALERVGCKFWFKADPDMMAFHMCHDDPKLDHPKRYKVVTFECLGWESRGFGMTKAELEALIKAGKVQLYDVYGVLGHGKCGLDTAPDEIQLVTKDVFNTEHPGSWACIEHFRDNPNLKFNEEIGFDLAEERREIGL